MLRGLFILLSCFLWGNSAISADCPPVVAAIADTELNNILIPKTQKLYRKLGCELNLANLPGRRGTVEFNAGKVDGELFRLPIIEKFYQVGFVRSKRPIFTLQQGVWIKAGKRLQKGSLIGYVIGRRWQEEYAEQNHEAYRFVKYSGSNELRVDYHAGQLDGFLSASPTIDQLMISGKLYEKPELALETSVVSLYHYLHQQYAPFMKEFDNMLKECRDEC